MVSTNPLRKIDQIDVILYDNFILIPIINDFCAQQQMEMTKRPSARCRFHFLSTEVRLMILITLNLSLVGVRLGGQATKWKLPKRSWWRIMLTCYAHTCHAFATASTFLRSHLARLGLRRHVSSLENVTYSELRQNFDSGSCETKYGKNNISFLLKKRVVFFFFFFNSVY